MTRCHLKKISVTEEVDTIIVTKVKEEFLLHNPKFKGMTLSRNFLILKMTEYYLKKLL
jgi:hypothetical protein